MDSCPTCGCSKRSWTCDCPCHPLFRTERQRLLVAVKQTFELVLAFTRPFLTGLIGLALVVGMASVNKREVVMPTVFERQPCTEDMPSCWKCRQMGNHQCTEGEVVP